MKSKCQPWFQTYTGLKFYPKSPTKEMLDIRDIAHALSLIPRFGGHTQYHYSVAQHCCLCCDNVGQVLGTTKMQALLHDAQEAYLGDIVKPLKHLLPEYMKIEDRLWKIIADRYRVPVELSPAVKAVDQVALATEKRDLLVEGPMWVSLKGITPWNFRINPWPPSVAEGEFLYRFHGLVLDNG